jgi:radical SAM protein with 4Fe4S-binding SPASM domain
MKKNIVKPFTISIEITSNCNLRCRHCYAGMGFVPSEFMLFSDFKKIINNISSLEPFYIYLGGGEPFSHPDIFKFINFIIKKKYNLILSTNGTLIDEDKVIKLKQLGVYNGIQISLDGIKNDHEFIRGKGTFYKIINAIKLFKKHGFIISVGTTLFDHNIDNIPKLITKLEKLNVDLFHIMMFMPTFFTSPIFYYDNRPKFSKLIKLNNYLKVNKNKLKITLDYGNLLFENNYKNIAKDNFVDLLSPIYKGYVAGYLQLIVLVNGDVIPCELLRDKKFIVGNLIKEDANKIWYESKSLELFRSNIRSKEKIIGKCNFCEYNNYCMSGCPASSYILYGDMMVPDTTCFKQPHLLKEIEFNDKYINDIFKKLNLIQYDYINKYIKIIDNLDLNNISEVIKIYDEIIAVVKLNSSQFKLNLLNKTFKIDNIIHLINEMKQIFSRTLGILWLADYYLLQKLENHINNTDKNKIKYIKIGEKYQKKINNIAPKIDVSKLVQKQILKLLDKEEIIFKNEDFITSNFILKIENYLKSIHKGICAYPSKVKGIIGKDILIGLDFSTSDDPLLIKSKGIIVETGGILSHPAIISREYKIPCLVSVKDLTKILKKGDLVYLNSKEGYFIKLN